MTTIYLDHAATTPLDERVLDAMLPHLREGYGNASSLHRLGRAARHAVEEARATVAELLGVEPAEVVFTSGGTESDNLALRGVLEAAGAESRLVTSAAEHEAILRPAEALHEAGYDVAILKPASHGAVTPEQLAAALRMPTALVSLMHANNEVGTMTPLDELAALAHEHGALLHTDAVQTAGLLPFQVDDLGADLVSISGHKLYGPKGVGALVVRAGVELQPQVLGGSQERGRRGGTEAVAQVVGLAEALRLAYEEADIRLMRLWSLQRRLAEALEDELRGVPHEVTTPLQGLEAVAAPHIVHVVFPPQDGRALDGEMLLMGMDLEGVCASAGSACTSGALEPSHVLSAMGFDRATASAALRFSLGIGTTEDDVDRAAEAAGRVARRVAESA